MVVGNNHRYDRNIKFIRIYVLARNHFQKETPSVTLDRFNLSEASRFEQTKNIIIVSTSANYVCDASSWIKYFAEQ